MLTLLPLAGWAQDYVVTLTTYTKTYGQADPAKVPLSAFTITPYNAEVKAAMENHLTLTRVQAGENVGEYEFEATWDGYDLGAGKTVQIGPNNGKIKIKKFDLSTIDGVTLAVPDQYYDGSAKEPAGTNVVVTVTNPSYPLLTTALFQGNDYTITSYGDATHDNVAAGVGNGVLTITGGGTNFEGEKKLYFDILGINIAGATVTYKSSAPAIYFNGKAQTVEKTNLEVTLGGAELAASEWDIDADAYENNTNASEAAVVTIKGKGSHAGTATGHFTILPRTNIDGLTITITDPDYTGHAATPDVTIVDNMGTVTPTTDDYTLTADDFTAVSTDEDAGEATLNITFKGNYNGAAATSKLFTINQLDFSTTTRTLTKETGRDDNKYYYNNTPIKPVVTIKNGDVALEVTTDYTLAYKTSADATTDEAMTALGNKKVVITPTGTGNYTNTAVDDLTYEVIARPLHISIGDLTVGMGADIVPQATISNYASDEDQEDLDQDATHAFALTFKYTKDNGVNWVDDVDDLGVGTWKIYPVVANLNTNYSFPATDELLLADENIIPGTLKITKSQIVLKVKNAVMTYGGADYADFELEHVSGLAADKVDAFMNDVTTGINNNLNQDKFEYNNAAVAGQKATLHANAAGYTITYTGTFDNDNYAISINTGKLVVNRKKVYAGEDNFEVAFDPTPYVGAAVSPVPTITDNGTAVDPGNFEIEYDTDFNVADNHVATFTAADNGDYEIYKNYDHDNDANTPNITLTSFEVNYAISKRTLTITAANRTLPYGSDFNAQLNDFTDVANKPTIEGLIGVDNTKDIIAGIVEGFAGKLIIKNIGSTTVGDHADALVPTFVDEIGDVVPNANVATNYTIAPVAGKLTIINAEIALKVKDTHIYYGDNVAKFYLEPTAESHFPEVELPNFDNIVTYDNALTSYDYDAERMKVVDAEGYPINYLSTATVPTATNYTIADEIGSGKLYVEKRPVTISVKAGIADVPYANLAAFKTALAANEGGAYVEITAGTAAYTDGITDLVTIALATTKIGENVITLTAKEGVLDNYDLTLNNGVVKITSDGVVDKTFWRVSKADFANADAAQMIHDLDGETINFVLKYNDDAAYNTLKPNKWYAMILPFETTTKKLSDAFGYAIVDLLNQDNDNEHRTYFSLHMSTEPIPANTPFIIKVWATIDMNADGVRFDNVQIEAPQAPQALDLIEVEDAAGNKFIGSYTGIDGLGAYKPEYSGHVTWWSLNQDDKNDNNAIKANDTAYLRQMSAFNYIASDPRAHEIVIEELGGQTTVIRNINGETQTFSGEGWYTLDGIKLQNVPTEKGVYIQNGKKVVIK